MDQRISEHISYKEATFSHTARKNKIDNSPNAEQLSAMKLVAEKVFEPLRKHFNKPLYITSFFRSLSLNNKLKGSKTSQHLSGEAIDIDGDLSNISNNDIFNWIKNNLEFDQLIIEDVDEKGNADWVHVSYSKTKNRKEVYKMQIINGKKKYTKIE
jgi:zinc D-Ala-D-Ala carboxypeptidase